MVRRSAAEPNRAPSGAQHAAAIASAARQGRVEGANQRLRVSAHGSLGPPIDAKHPNQPGDASLILGAGTLPRLEINYRIMTAHRSTLTNIELTQRRDANSALDRLREEFAASHVTELVLDGCNLGKHQAFLDYLSGRLSTDKNHVAVKGHEGFVVTRMHPETNAAGEKEDVPQVGIRPSQYMGQTHTWEEVGKASYSPRGDLPTPAAASAPNTAPIPSPEE